MLSPHVTLCAIRRRRQRAVRCGGLILFALSMAACIFDSGKNFQGGGRRETPVISPTASESAEPTTSGTGPPKLPDGSTELPDVGATPLPDASDQ